MVTCVSQQSKAQKLETAEGDCRERQQREVAEREGTAERSYCREGTAEI